ncbi:MAG TPA: hypothetical protein EYN89_00985, partial [Flavobacteriales bacterium]|nr:hypothetical protein [Flavobacteriales bacterium]
MKMKNRPFLILPCLLSLLWATQPNVIYSQDYQEDGECETDFNSKAVKFYKKSEGAAKKDRGEAIKLLRDAIELDPDYPAPYYKLGRMAMGSENYNIAKKYFLQVLDLCPTYNLYLHYYLGKIFFGSEEFSKAVYHLAEFMKYPDGIKTDRHFNIAKDLEEEARFYGSLIENPVPFKPKNVPGICTQKDEYLPYITADQKTIYFTRKFQKKALGDLFPKMVEVFTSAHRTDGDFSRGKAMMVPFNKGNNEGGACLTIDNMHMYYTICKKLTNGYNNCDIYSADYVKIERSTLIDLGFMTEVLEMTEQEVKFELEMMKNSGLDYMWTNVRPLNDLVNKIDSWESQPTISSDGRTLYFASNRKGGVGGIDIYKTTKDPNGKWTQPVGLGKNINTEGHEKSPFMHPDKKTLYFSSDGHRGLGGFDIFFAKMKKTDTGYEWEIPQNIGFPINSEDNDLGFFVSTDGETGYFSSTNESEKYLSFGGWDLFYFPLYEEARPSEIIFLKGELKDEKGEPIVGGSMDVTNVRTKETTKVDVDSMSGKYAVIMTLEEDHEDDFVVSVTKENYTYASKLISTKGKTKASASASTNAKSSTNPITITSANNNTKTNENTNASTNNKTKTSSKINRNHKELVQKLDVRLEQLVVGEPYRLDNINFATNSSSVLTVASMVTLDGFAKYLISVPEMIVAIQGHTDNV